MNIDINKVIAELDKRADYYADQSRKQERGDMILGFTASSFAMREVSKALRAGMESEDG